jgi:hypothetical protein
MLASTFSLCLELDILSAPLKNLVCPAPFKVPQDLTRSTPIVPFR